MNKRRATHAGSWYPSSPDTLSRSLTTWLSEAAAAASGTASSAAGTTAPPPLAAIIAPHAGYSYSGPSASHAYAAINPSQYKTVFVLGPSHHVHVRNRACVTSCRELDTPLGQLSVAKDVNAELLAEQGPDGEKLFIVMDTSVDEDEHSIEMHLPYLRHIFGDDAEPGGRVQFVPVMIGSLDAKTEKALGSVFARWLGDSESLIVISTDFCHWGERFDYCPVNTDGKGGEIWEGIERLDREGMAACAACSRSRFSSYISRTRNTVCGRYPVGCLLAAIEANGGSVCYSLDWVHYEQSSKCKATCDSSVSYASALVRGHGSG
jgi:MEMO1 family protein